MKTRKTLVRTANEAEKSDQSPAFDVSSSNAALSVHDWPNFPRGLFLCTSVAYITTCFILCHNLLLTRLLCDSLYLHL